MELLDLPEEVLVSIFSYLSMKELFNCRRVNKTFARLIRDPTFWRGRFEEIKATSDFPSPRLWCSSACYGNKWYLFGGHTTNGNTNIISSVMNDFYEFDLETKTWTKLEHSITAKTEHKCVVSNDKLWFVGGYNGQWYTNEIYCFDPKTKVSELVETTGERFSFRSALTVVVWKKKLISFGGWNGFSKTWFNDLNIFDTETRNWTKLEPKGIPPLNRTSHSALVYKDCMYVFGGFSGTTYLNDLQELNLETNTWTDISHLCTGKFPSPRSRFTAIIYEDGMYILGGWNKCEYFSDMYCFDFNTRHWTEISNTNGTIPCISQCSASVYKNKLYTFGGFCGKKKECINDIYVCLLPQTFPTIPSSTDHDWNSDDQTEKLEPAKKRTRYSSLETSP